MRAIDLYNGIMFTYGRHKKPITLKRMIVVSDYSGGDYKGVKCLIIPEKGKQFFLDGSTPVFKYEPFLYIIDEAKQTLNIIDK